MSEHDDGPDSGLGKRLVSLGSATLGASGAAIAMARLSPMWPGACFAAPAFTVACAPGDNLAIHAGVARAPAGCVLAVAVAGDLERGYFGEVLTVAAMARGVEALVIDGTVRDLDAIERRRFPVFARGSALPDASKAGPGSVGSPVVIGNCLVESGDWIVGDRDGLVVIRVAELESVLERGERRAAREQVSFDQLLAGATTVELHGLDVTSVTVGGQVLGIADGRGERRA